MMNRQRRSPANVELGSSSPNYALLRDAIGNREVVSASYTGFRREFCPHALGRHEGIVRVIAWQHGGAAPEGAEPAWRCFDLDKLRNVTSRPGRWRSGTPAEAPRACVDTIEAVVDDFDVTDWNAVVAAPEPEAAKLQPLGKLEKLDKAPARDA